MSLLINTPVRTRSYNRLHMVPVAVAAVVAKPSERRVLITPAPAKPSTFAGWVTKRESAFLARHHARQAVTMHKRAQTAQRLARAFASEANDWREQIEATADTFGVHKRITIQLYLSAQQESERSAKRAIAAMLDYRRKAHEHALKVGSL